MANVLFEKFGKVVGSSNVMTSDRMFNVLGTLGEFLGDCDSVALSGSEKQLIMMNDDVEVRATFSKAVYGDMQSGKLTVDKLAGLQIAETQGANDENPYLLITYAKTESRAIDIKKLQKSAKTATPVGAPAKANFDLAGWEL